MVSSASGELDGGNYAFSLTAIDRYAHAINLELSEAGQLFSRDRDILTSTERELATLIISSSTFWRMNFGENRAVGGLSGGV